MTAADERTVPVRVRLVELPPDRCAGHDAVRATMQRGRDGVVEGTLASDGALVFDGTLRARPAPDGGVRFLGDLAFGSTSGRHLYVVWSGVPGGGRGGARTMFRRMKLMLGDVTWAQVEDAARDGALVATVRATARDGTPACARVPIVGGWQVGPRAPASSL